MPMIEKLAVVACVVCMLDSCVQNSQNTFPENSSGISGESESPHNNREELNVIYLSAFKKIKSAEVAKSQQEHIELLKQALDEFKSLQRIDPSWKKSIVDARISDTESKLAHNYIDCHSSVQNRKLKTPP